MAWSEGKTRRNSLYPLFREVPYTGTLRLGIHAVRGASGRSAPQAGPKGYPLDESEPPASYVPKSHPFDGPKALASYVRKRDLSLATIIFSLGAALLLGSAHALSPSHGKTMVAAYLNGSRGTRREAVLLGGIVTFTHVISVLLLGLICLHLSKHVVAQKLFPRIGAASGVVIFMVGYWMLAKRALGLEHGHSHHGHHHVREAPHRIPGTAQAQAPYVDETTFPGPIAQHHHHGPRLDHEHHEHGHGHEHHPRGHITTGGLVSLGLAGGMVRAQPRW